MILSKRNIVLFIVVIACFVSLYAISICYHFFRTPLTPKEAVAASVKVYPNQTVSELIQRLTANHIVQHPWLFALLIKTIEDQHPLRFGEYSLAYPTTAWQLLKNITTGKGLTQHRLTIIEGWTFRDIRDAMLQDENLTQELGGKSSRVLLQLLGSTYKNPEGLFYPNTYFFTWRNADITIYKTAYQAMQAILQKAWENRAPDLPYQNAYQALIAASLIERETPIAAEKPLIADVIVNRLNKRMRLQIDPTVQYGLREPFGEIITKKDLKTKTPYNTYFIYGLPPTPICMPSTASIEAALHPEKTGYLYFVATGDGGHRFSRTYGEHQIQVKQYREELKS
ncbi:MAG TPA: endolytic transglycosylase MltG [Coxiellaceae bacterium]|nr:endolytic transglycosylase MltG [Coxiellaceae bacterium]